MPSPTKKTKTKNPAPVAGSPQHVTDIEPSAAEAAFNSLSPRLAEYWLSDDVKVAAELAAIRIGTGYQDLANDLVALAALCERHQPVLSQDRKLYQAGDAALAKQLAGQILHRLGDAATAEQSR